MNQLFQSIERHKELADLAIKAAGITVTLAIGFAAGLRYFADRGKARAGAELDLRRQAYFDLFSSMPGQLKALGKYASDREAIEVPIETYTAINRLHLLANAEALLCIIKGNAIFHEGLLEMSALKRRAIQFEKSGDPRMAEKAVDTWDAFRDRFKKLISDWNANYRKLLVLARKEIGLNKRVDEIVAALEEDEKTALAALERHWAQ